MQMKHKFCGVHSLSAVAKWAGSEPNTTNVTEVFTKASVIYVFTKLAGKKLARALCFMSFHDCEGGYEWISCLGYQTKAAQYKQCINIG